MRHQLRSISCDQPGCDEEFEQDGFITPEGEVTWPILELAAREEGWSTKRGQHLCPHHAPEWEPW